MNWRPGSTLSLCARCVLLISEQVDRLKFPEWEGIYMNKQHYYSEKTSDTSADTLLAVGFASLLKEVLRQNGKQLIGIMIRDIGPYYQVQIPTPITDNDLQNLKPFAIIKPLVTEKHID